MYHDWGYYATDYNSAVGGLVAGLFVFLIALCILVFVICLLKIIGMWKILDKANQPGWGALIPFYNTYLLCKISGVNPWWIVILLCSSVISCIPIIGSLVCCAASVYFMVLLNVSLARSFKKDDSFAIGLILLPPVFYLMLGCSGSKYEGEKPMEDIIFKQVNLSSDNNHNKSNIKNDSSDKEKHDEVSYCSQCGSKIDEFTRFCPNCGSEIK